MTYFFVLSSELGAGRAEGELLQFWLCFSELWNVNSELRDINSELRFINSQLQVKVQFGGVDD